MHQEDNAYLLACLGGVWKFNGSGGMGSVMSDHAHDWSYTGKGAGWPVQRECCGRWQTS